MYERMQIVVVVIGKWIAVHKQSRQVALRTMLGGKCFERCIGRCYS